MWKVIDSVSEIDLFQPFVVVEPHPDFPGELLFQSPDQSRFVSEYRDWISRYGALNELFNLRHFVETLAQDGILVYFSRSCEPILAKYEEWSQELSVAGFNLDPYPFQGFGLNRALEAAQGHLEGSVAKVGEFFFGWCCGSGKSLAAAAGAQELFNRGQVDIVLAFTLQKLKKNFCDFFTRTTQLSPLVVDGTAKKRQKMYEDKEVQVFVLNFDKLWADIDSLKALVADKRVLFVLDEALALDTAVLTRDRGWQTVKSLLPGDFVPGSKGWVRVVRKTEVFLGHKCFRVTFQGGDSVVCTSNHIWTVQGARWQGKDMGNFEIRTDELPIVLKAAAHWNRALAVPTADGVECPDRELPIDPYVLGYWLGDGDSHGPTISVHQEDSPHLIKRFGELGYVVTYEDERRVSFSVPGANARNTKSFRNQLKSLGVLGNKHIPDEYLMASRSQRLELLRGLMDSDGCCLKDSSAVFTQKPGPVLTGTEQLIRSLGIHCRVRTVSQGAIKTENPAIQLSWVATTDLNPFSMPRKAGRVTKESRVSAKKIVSVCEVESVPAQCIEVDSEDHLFAVGKQWTLTHNCHVLITDGRKNRCRRAYEEILKECGRAVVWPMSATVVNHSPLRYRDVFNLTGSRKNPLGSKASFESRYAKRKYLATYGMLYEWDMQKLQEIRHRVSDRTQSVRKTDPALRDTFKGLQAIVVPVQMSKEDRRLYDEIVEEARIARCYEESLAPYYQMLRYVCNNPLALTRTEDAVGKALSKKFDCTDKNCSKLELFLDQVEALQDSDEQVVVFTQWTNLSLFLLRDSLAKRKIRHVSHYGVGQSAKESQAAQDTFKNDPTCTVFLSSDAGAYGLNFQNARYVINYESPYSYDVLHQRNSRIDRADSYLEGLTSYIYVTEDSVEERIWGINQSRKELASATTGSKEVLGYGKEMSASSLDYLIFGKEDR